MVKNILKSSKFEFSCLVKWTSFPLIFLGLFLLSSTYAHSAVWYVSPAGSDSNAGDEWTVALATIQVAIDRANSGDEIWVKQGTYNLDPGVDPVTVSEINVYISVEILGGFNGTETATEKHLRNPKNNITTVDGQDGFNVRCFHFRQNATLDGFTITGGNVDYQADGGGGILIDNCSPTIRNCVITDNYGLYGAGGIAFKGASSEAVIINTLISDNLGGFTTGGIGCGSSSPSIINCIVIRNSGETVGGINCGTGSPNIINSTIYGNACSYNFRVASGIACQYATGTIVNTIVWGNRNDEGASGPVYQISPVSSSAITYCNIDQDGFAGINGNIRSDPLFANPAGGGFSLFAGSPCIDTGDNTAVPAGVTTDLDGDPRVIDGDGNSSAVVDMGAYEFQSTGVDITPPVITLIGASPLELEIGTPYSEPGATAIDDVDGDISASILIDSSSVDSDALGSYIVTYNVSDSAGNPATQVERIVNVGDSVPPTTGSHAPVKNQPNVAVNSNIVVHILDSGSGVDSDSIVVTVTEEGAAVFGSTNFSGDENHYTVTFDPDTNFGNLKAISVTVSASDFANNPMTDTYGFQTADVGGSTWDAADDDGDGVRNSEEDLLGTSRTTKTIFVRPNKFNAVTESWEYWSDFVAVLFPHATKAGYADALAFTDAGIEVVVIGAETDYLAMRDFDYDPGDPLKNIDLTLDPSGTPIDFAPDTADPATVGWQGPHCDILEIRYYPPDSRRYCEVTDECDKNHGHLHFTGSNEFRWDTKGFTPNFSPHHNYYQPLIFGFAQQNYFDEACFDKLEQGESPIYETAPFPADYECKETAIENQCYQFRSTYSSPLNLNKSDPTDGSPDDWVEFKSITFNADKTIDCFDEDCDLTEPLAVGEAQFDFNAVLRRTTMHEWGHAFLLAIPADHCGTSNCILQAGVDDWTLHPFGTTCGHKAAIQGAVHNIRH